jgi:hypothetical protein
LEYRIFEVSGLARGARDIQEADDNMSTIEDDEELKQEQLQSAWKKILHRLNRLSAKFHAKIRAIVVEAIAAARKAHLGEVVGQLRSALLLFHPEAAGQCKSAALKVLEEHGGYHDIDDDDEDEDGDEDKKPLEESNKEEPEVGISTVLCADAGSLNSSLEGQDRADWIAAVKSAKTVSKFASLAVAFANKASKALDKLESEREALSNFMDAMQKGAGKKRKSAGGEPVEPAEIWTNVDVTDEYCFAKILEWPWWPAKKCHAKDVELAASLETLGLTLVSLLGDSGDLRVVKTAESLMPFSETHPTEDLSAFSRHRRNLLDEAMSMARRLIRSKEKKPANKKRKSSQPPAKKSSDSDFKDEKKLAT